ncbi:16S rRNA (cytidine(1402)-2'-O)-methyltransferase [Nitrospira moscoviensis]|uniref:Putative Methyltransferase n=1 Tax=Nitrospira moscoviensis TaxID=42253 RepID=A0A0K2GB64_NITMO|nr:SAM-dependent methyltransferase [Nitrospira moscoviensis]ALA58190.1 putative Methyltransferase [Nitrospira moscoviensis]
MAAPARGASPASGLLYVAAVPIGHPDDITLRALQLLREVDLVASEDPAATRALLSRHGIDVTLTSYGPRNLKEKVAVLLHRLTQGARIAIVSDCGSPVIADPGCRLIAAAHAAGIPVRCLPGSSAVSAALTVSGFAADAFGFYGRLPRRRSALTRSLDTLLAAGDTAVAFCPSGSLSPALDAIARLTPRRRIVVACDLTTRMETILRGTARQVQTELARRPAPSQVTLVVAGKERRKTTGGRRRR